MAQQNRSGPSPDEEALAYVSIAVLVGAIGLVVFAMLA